MALRTIHPVLEGWFANEYDFAYAHLIKFEKPIKTEAGKSAKKATDYVTLLTLLETLFLMMGL